MNEWMNEQKNALNVFIEKLASEISEKRKECLLFQETVTELLKSSLFLFPPWLPLKVKVTVDAVQPSAL